MQLGDKRVAAVAVLIAHSVEVARVERVELCRGDLLDCCRAQAALAPFERLRHEVLVLRDDHTDARTACGEALGYRVDNNDVVLVALVLQCAREVLAAVGELSVHLVADDEEVMLLRNVEHQVQLLRSEHVAGRVAGVRYHYGAGVLVYARLDPLAVGVEIALLGIGRHGADSRAREGDGGVVVRIERLRNDDLVAAVEQAGHRQLQCLTAAGGRQDLAVLKLHSYAGVIVLHRVEELGHADGRRVGEYGFGEISERFEKYVRRFNVGLADVQMINFNTAFFGLCRIACEFTHGGKAAALHF